MSASLSYRRHASRAVERPADAWSQDDPRKRRAVYHGPMIAEKLSLPRWKFASEPIRLSGVRLHFSSSDRHLWKVCSAQFRALLDGNDPVDRHLLSDPTPARPLISRDSILARFPLPNDPADH